MENDAPIPLSALQHYLYCPRQCALIHVEQQWAENRRTAEGRLLHERADRPGHRAQGDARSVSSLPLANEALGVRGIADVVEFRRSDGRDYAYPIEYKRGRPKSHRADEVQLCAQALCLEEMLGVPVLEGALFYGKTRRRKVVAIDAELRRLTLATIADVRAMVVSGHTPLPVYDSRLCEACSMLEICQPKALSGSPSVLAWLAEQLKE